MRSADLQQPENSERKNRGSHPKNPGMTTGGEEVLSNREGGEQETQPHIGISRIIGWDHRAERRFLLGNKPPSSWMYDCPSLNMPTSLHPHHQ